ncbi:hypothetical protein GGX14DRAFT_536977 [Mycena pura]|uniref:Tetraspanin Tsp2 family n=1 Tax=Mycena pura TaxID=153505 RepID=A0AAD6Y357_9AGAR|nr:hypothetical protein GGX14DRAFT_536977 [Mycena pura]
MQYVWSVYLDGKRASINRPPRRPFLRNARSSSSRSSLLGPPFNGSNVSLQLNYVPSKFAAHSVRQRGLGKGVRGVEAFRPGEPRVARSNSESYDGADVGEKTGRAKWNKFKWMLVASNTVYMVLSLGALMFIITAWLDAWDHADVLRVGNRAELVFSTIAASMALLTAIIGWAGIVLNNRAFLAVYTFLLWISFALLVIPGYITYRKYAFNLEGKVNKQWSTGIGSAGRLRIQNQLKCCGYYSPFVEATVSATCYSRTILPGCKKVYWNLEKQILRRWFVTALALVPLTVAAIIVGLLCSNHVTYRFGKGMMPKAYRMSEKSMAAMAYAAQLAEQYGPDVAEKTMAQSSSNLASTPMSDGH